jgi:hypothetical protein
LTDGLVAYWPFNEGGGSTAFDAAGDNDGTINGGASYTSTGIAPTSGNVSALTFDGADDVVAVPHADALDMTTAYTIATWVVIDNINDYQAILSRGDASGNDIEVYWHPASYQGLTVVHNRMSGGSYDGGVYFASPPVGTLFHLAVVFDGMEVKAYYDGVQAALSGGGCCGHSAALPTPPDNNKGWQIGRVEIVSNVPFQGLMDEVRVYNRALNESEIAALANSSSVPNCETDLAQCEADLTECLANPLVPDQDGDGEADATDTCPNTSEGAEVDQAGCSLEQFCTAIDATTTQGARICNKSDWRNDELLMRAKEADCMVAKTGRGRADDRCVPR